jgi:CBS domain-containing protein
MSEPFEETGDVEELRVSDAMVTSVVICGPDESVTKAAQKMAENDVGSVVVVNGKGSIVGIITDGDIVRRVVAKGLDPNRTLVRHVMTPNPVTIYEDAPLSAAADLMSRKRIGHLPVVNRDGKLVGIITRSDIIRYAPSLLEILYLKSA